MADVLRSPRNPLDHALLAPPPPPPDDDRSPRHEDLPLPPPPDADRSPPRKRGREPEDVLLTPPPPLGSSRPERLVYRLEDDPSPRSGRSSSPGGGLARRHSPPRRSRPRSNDGVRRHSSPRRSPSPVPPKRPRRDDGAYRRIPLRGGRYGRGGDRGRFTWHRAPDCPDSGYGASSNGQDITQRKGLMTYKQFTQILEDDVSPGEAESRYQEYRTAYITTQKRAYFDLHKNEVWLKDKYHPTNLLSVIERRNEFCKATSKSLILDLRSGTLDLWPGMTAGAASKSGNGNNGSSEDDEDYVIKRRKHGRGPPKETEQLSTAPKAHPVSSQYRRIQIDIDQTLALVQKLDAEKGIVGNILLTGDHGESDVGSMESIVIVRGLTTVKGLEGVELLDTLLTYLWRVHGVDYYGMSEKTDAKGLRHVRADYKSASTFNISAADWEKKLDSFWQERLMIDEDPLVVLTAKDKIDAATDEILEPYVRKIRDDKYGWTYGCGAKGCAKVFHAPEFVQKHLRFKHPDLVSVLTLRVQEDIYFQNYMNDPNDPGGVPVMQQSAPDRMRRRPDEQMLGTFGVQGSNAPFVHEFPAPPVLMPVPGAGPLGPFVPAPPEIAMQMMREQGPPRPNGAPHGKKPVILGPMIPMHPSYPRDPRPLRSYNDLDAPEEEVTVVDYRSRRAFPCYPG